MAEEYNPFLEANKNLVKKIDELEKRISDLSWFEREFPHLERRCKQLEKQLEIKRKVLKVNGIYPDDRKTLYSLMVTVAEDTPEGIYIVVELPPKEKEKNG